jgi:preprotein translocase SecE subunit
MSNFIEYLKDTQREVSHVSWPTNRQALVYTGLVIGISIIIGVLLGAFDHVFSLGLDWFIAN